MEPGVKNPRFSRRALLTKIISTDRRELALAMAEGIVDSEHALTLSLLPILGELLFHFGDIPHVPCIQGPVTSAISRDLSCLLIMNR